MHQGGTILLTIDVEDWFQVENFKPWIPFSSWSSHELRVEKNTHRILDLLDSFNGPRKTGNGRGNKPAATFFVLGWIAKRVPHLIREIHARGHEVASHGYYHRLCEEETPANFKKDLTDTKELLEDILGAPVSGYRAPSFSITDEILRTIADCGYLYDSSYNSFAMHGRYGHMDFSQNGRKGIALRFPRNTNPGCEGEVQAPNAKHQTFFELPISNMKLGSYILPWGGGAYFRLIPFSLFRMGVQSILEKEAAYLFYIHPWELDPDQPCVTEASIIFNFRHRANLKASQSKLFNFLRAFNHCDFVSCRRYLEREVDNAP